ncbi:hypothetical protein SCLARK_00261 [Spiroplasma clarkii]|nr:hypothetical protein SCLARK_00261 [Spiroplasma clarkii]
MVGFVNNSVNAVSFIELIAMFCKVSSCWSPTKASAIIKLTSLSSQRIGFFKCQKTF